MMSQDGLVKTELFARMQFRMALKDYTLSLVKPQWSMLETKKQYYETPSEVFQVPVEELPATANRFFGEWKEQRKRIEALEAEIVRLRTSGGGDDMVEVEGVRIVIMEVDGDLKQMTKMLKELTLDDSKPTLIFLGVEKEVAN